MLGWLGQIRPLLDERCHLYVSSANRTGDEVAATAATANTTFGDEFLVIDADAARDQSVASGSATIVRVGPQQQVDVVRHGINDAGFAGDTSRFLQELTERWETRQRCQGGAVVTDEAARTVPRLRRELGFWGTASLSVGVMAPTLAMSITGSAAAALIGQPLHWLSPPRWPCWW